MKKLLVLFVLCGLIACKKDVPAESDEAAYKKFTFDNENYLVEEISGRYWTRNNFNAVQFGGREVSTNFPSNVVTGRTYAYFDGIASFIPPNGYSLPTKEDFLELMKAAGFSGTWTPLKDNHDINGKLYEITDMTVINKLLDDGKWAYTEGNNQLKFWAQPTGKGSEGGVLIESLKLLGRNTQEKIYLEFKIRQNNTGYVRLYVYDIWNNTDVSRYSVRFVKDVKEK